MEAVFLWLANLSLGWVLGRPRPGIELAIESRALLALVGGGGGTALETWRAVLRVHIAARTPFTVRRVGWVAGDGERIEATLDARADPTLHRGGPAVSAVQGAGTLADFMRTHRGLSRVFVRIVGSSQEHTFA